METLSTKGHNLHGTSSAQSHQICINDYSTNYKSRLTTLHLHFLLCTGLKSKIMSLLSVSNNHQTIKTFIPISPLSPPAQRPQAPKSLSTTSAGPCQLSTLLQQNCASLEHSLTNWHLQILWLHQDPINELAFSGIILERISTLTIHVHTTSSACVHVAPIVPTNLTMYLRATSYSTILGCTVTVPQHNN